MNEAKDYFVLLNSDPDATYSEVWEAIYERKRFMKNASIDYTLHDEVNRRLTRVSNLFSIEDYYRK